MSQIPDDPYIFLVGPARGLSVQQADRVDGLLAAARDICHRYGFAVRDSRFHDVVIEGPGGAARQRRLSSELTHMVMGAAGVVAFELYPSNTTSVVLERARGEQVPLLIVSDAQRRASPVLQSMFPNPSSWIRPDDLCIGDGPFHRWLEQQGGTAVTHPCDGGRVHRDPSGASSGLSGTRRAVRAMRETLARLLHAARSRAGMNQEDMRARVGHITIDEYRAMEEGVHQYSDTQLMRLTELGIPDDRSVTANQALREHVLVWLLEAGHPRGDLDAFVGLVRALCGLELLPPARDLELLYDVFLEQREG